MQRVRSGLQSRAQKGGESAVATKRIKASTQEGRPLIAGVLRGAVMSGKMLGLLFLEVMPCGNGILWLLSPAFSVWRLAFAMVMMSGKVGLQPTDPGWLTSNR
jgi:hypothetical protein